MWRQTLSITYTQRKASNNEELLIWNYSLQNFKTNQKQFYPPSLAKKYISIYIYIDTYTKINGQEMNILNRYMNGEKESILMALAVQHHLISRCYKHIFSSHKLNNKELKSMLMYWELLRVKSLELSWSQLDQYCWPMTDRCWVH